MKIDEQTKKAIKAYQLAIKYREYIENKWIPRAVELRQLDSFHRTHVAWENDDYRAENLVKYAGRMLLCTAVGQQFWEHPIQWKHFEECRNRRFLKSFKLLVELKADQE